MSHAPTFPAIFYTSSTPQSVGASDCPYRRWHGNHAGVHGTGWRRHATAVPLATGKSFHRGLELLAGWLLDWQKQFPQQRLLDIPVEVTAWAANEAAAGYEATARRKGLLQAANDAQAAAARETLIQEQATLVEGMVWVWALMRLPALLSEYVIVAVEEEEGLMLDCTCGLPNGMGDLSLHLARGCAGIYHQTRVDQLWKHVERGTYAVLEFKGWGQTNFAKEKNIEASGQLLTNMETASRKFNVPVQEAFVDLLIKGRFGRDQYAPDTERKYQQSALCQGYFDPGNLPMRPAQWEAERYHVDEQTGKRHQIPSSYHKTGLWESPAEHPIPEIRPGATRVESWVRGYLSMHQLAKMVKVLGPFQRNQLRVPLAIAGIAAEERRWREDIEFLRSQGAYMPDHPLVDQLISRTWHCWGFDGTPCEAIPTCWREIGWEHPENSGKFERRRPHHQPELDAVVACGVVLPEADEDEGGEAGDAE